MRQRIKRAALTAALVLGAGLAPPGTARAGASDYLGEVTLVGFTFCPRNTFEANGALLPISSWTALFSLYGTQFGGDGRTTFGLPDLRGRLPVHVGAGPGLTAKFMGQKGGNETHTITVPELPAHSHTVNATDETANKNGPGNDFLAKVSDKEADIYHDGPANKQMDPGMISSTGGNLSTPTQDPSLGLRFCINASGTYPSRS